VVKVATSSKIFSGRVRALVEANDRAPRASSGVATTMPQSGKWEKTATTALIATMAESRLLIIAADVVRVPKKTAHPVDNYDDYVN
jgi:hypothetical protein